jgi:GxxExxY protein
MKVYTTLGNGFQEVIYQRTPAIEMEDNGLNLLRKMEMPVFYKEQQVDVRRVDFYV